MFSLKKFSNTMIVSVLLMQLFSCRMGSIYGNSDFYGARNYGPGTYEPDYQTDIIQSAIALGDEITPDFLIDSVSISNLATDNGEMFLN